MKHLSKIICLILVVTSCSVTFSMLRRALAPRSSQQLSRVAQARALTATTKAAPAEHTGIQQKWTELKEAGWNAWNKLSNMLFKTPAIAPSQPLKVDIASSDGSAMPSVTTSIGQEVPKKSTTIAQEIAPVLEAITISKESLPEKKETALMVCTPPGIEIDYISKLKSFEEVEHFLKSEKINILKEAELSDHEINNLLAELDKDRKYIHDNFYRTPLKKVSHDQTLHPEILEEIITKLKQANINPLCVDIINKPKEKMKGSFALAGSPYSSKTDGDYFFNNITLTFSQEMINEAGRERTGFTISHEIGHLIRCHSHAKILIEHRMRVILRKKNGLDEEEIIIGHIAEGGEFVEERDPLSLKIEKTVEDALKKLKALHELEADITYSMQDKNVAQNFLKTFQSKISSGELNTTKGTDIHQSSNLRFHWGKRILDIHKAKESEKE